MIYLLLSLILACLTYLVYKIADAGHYDSDSITLYNYVVAAALAITNAILHSQYEIFQYVLQGNLWTLTTVKSRSNTAVILVVIGVLSGVFVAVNLFQTKNSIAANGAGITSFFKQTGFIGGLFIAILFFGERPSGMQWIGIAGIILALVLMVSDFGMLDIHGPKLLLALLLSGAIVEADNKFFSQYALGGYHIIFLAIAFSVAGIYSISCVFYKYRRNFSTFTFSVRELIWGSILGAGNLLNNYFKLKSLEMLPASVVIPTISAGTLILTTLIGALLYKEKVNRRMILSMAAAQISIVLLNLSA
ncbi:MAG: hypothetical protein HFG69_02690 [Hungatella sp.]|jgi:drug/metabolite transporter (DMT)-like permease|nr:hypothetical protein [Hungatella sp.]